MSGLSDPPEDHIKDEDGTTEEAVKEEKLDIDIEMAEGDDEDDDDEEMDVIKLAVKEANNLPEGFVEWEAVSLNTWRRASNSS